MQDIINQSRQMDDKSLEKWIYDNMHQNEEIAADFNNMVANFEIQKEEAEEDENVCIGELEESYGWGLRYFFLMLNGADEEDARNMAEYR